MKTPTPTELNVAICELQGWEKQAVEQIWWSRELSKYATLNELPNHITGASARGNLNEAILRLDKNQRIDFICNLASIRKVRYPVFVAEIFTLCFEATNTELATALVRVIKPEMFQ